jgi:hypothetical protein
MLYLALSLSVILLLIANVSVRLCPPKSQVPTGLCIVCAVLGFGCLFHGLFFVNSILVVMAVGACAAAGARPSRVLLASLGMTVAAYVLATITAIAPELEKWSELKEQFPMESMTDRLAKTGTRNHVPKLRSTGLARQTLDD